MFNLYLYLRYTVFGIFIASNAIIASVAVWNLSLLQAAAIQPVPAVFYLIFVGAFALTFIFTVIFIELARSNSITSHVSFESSWVSFFFVLELAGAVSFSATVPASTCSVENNIQGSCASTRVLQAFTFIAASTLFGYLLVLLHSCFVRRQHRPGLWRCNVYDLSSLSSQVVPLTPTLPRFINGNSPIVAPQPRRPAADLLYSYRFGLSPDYEIEHFQPSIPPIRTASSSLHHTLSDPSATFYPRAVQASLVSHPLPMVADPHQQRSATSRSPAPLGDWPRRDILQQPVRTRDVPSSAGSEMVSSMSPSRRRPTGPRNQSSTDEGRPPPLDLSQITTLKDPTRQ